MTEEIIRLDLRSVACPMNYVRTKLKLESMQTNALLEVTLDDGEAINSVAKSVTEDGNEILQKSQNSDSSWNLVIRHCKN